MNVAFRVDASSRIGAGHVMRCVALARQVRRYGGQARFVCRVLRGDLIGHIRSLRFPVDTLAGDRPAGRADAEVRDARGTRRVLAGWPVDWLVVDHYDLGIAWEQAARSIGGRILAIDDVGRAHDADAVLDQSWRGPDRADPYDGRVPAAARRLLGPRFALLQPEYAWLRRLAPARGPVVRRVLVSFGGADPTHETEKVLAALSSRALAHLTADVVIGRSHRDPTRFEALARSNPALVIHRAVSSLAGLVLRADFAVGAGGISVWERLCLRLPAAVVAVAENQVASARALGAAGYVAWLGSADEATADDYGRALSAPHRPAPGADALVDGLGAKRSARFLFHAQASGGVARAARRTREGAGGAPVARGQA
jgi:UDP-2,4-diacetamido-2,4,6-trideoxy-beta-L-altropyranose hydrolase